MARRQSITIKEVAELAGVSQMTVSRVLNNAEAVRPETRERVQSAIKELNYRPNLMARSLARGQSKLLGLVYQETKEAELNDVLVSALKACRAMGHQLVVEDLTVKGGRSPDTAKLVDRLSVLGIDGLIVTPQLARHSDLMNALSKLPLELVLLGASDAPGSFAQISFDDFGGATQLTNHLIEHGHKRIAFISGGDDCLAGKARREGYEKALKDQGLQPNERFVKPGRYTFESGMKAAEELLSGPDRPTAIFCANDEMAAGAVVAAHRKGLNLPADLSIVGFDDTDISNTVWPQITTIRQPIGRMAELAVQYLSQSAFPRDLKDSKILSDDHLQITRVDLIKRDSVSGRA